MVKTEKHPDKFATDEMETRQSPDNGTPVTKQNDGSRIHASQNQVEVAFVTPHKALQDPDASPSSGDRISQLDKEGSVSSLLPAKVSQTGSSVTLSGQEGKTLISREKVSEDGYHWRKYGQKLVKGNEFVRSYYKCTHPNCRVKKQLERSHDGQIVDVVYFGPHDHPKPEQSLPLAVGFVLSVEEKARHHLSTSKQDDPASPLHERRSNSQISTVALTEGVKGVLSESTRIRDEIDNDDNLRAKRQKKANHDVEAGSVDKPSGEPRLVVQTLSEVDIVNDGYRWRKYGQKLVKGNLNPRSYYRCSSPGCPVKKHVERASHDAKVVITSYEGQHDHDMPPSRTVTHNAAGSAVHSTESSAKSGGSDGVVHSLGPSGNSKEQLSESGNKSKEGNVNGSGIADNKSNELQNGKSSATVGSDTSGTDKNTVGKPSLASDGRSSEQRDGRSSEQRDGESRAEPKVNYIACSVRTITPGAESNPNAEPVQS